MIANIRFLILLERGRYNDRHREFVVMLLYIYVCCLGVSRFVMLPLPAMLFFPALTYVWTRYNPDDKIVIFGLVPVRAQYYPVVNIILCALQKEPLIIPILAAVIGHIYWIVDDQLPGMIGVNLWKTMALLRE